MSLNESQIIELIKNIFKPILASGAKNLLDDGAELPPVPAGHTRVVSLDAFQEHNDFKIGLGPLESAGHRAITQNLSDLAAMGAKPVGFLWSLELPTAWLEDQALYLKQFCEGALKVCQETNLQFYGGDLSASKNYFSCAITIFGDVAGKPLGRQGAKPGDKIYVSRELGASAAGLETMLKKIPPGPPFSKGGENHLYPKAELELGQKLVSVATACMDVSDGLAKDLTRLCKASKVGARVHTVPTHPEATREQALYGGEDYALLFTLPSGACLPKPWRREVRFCEIGEITENPNELPFQPGGFDHFSSFSAGQTPL